MTQNQTVFEVHTIAAEDTYVLRQSVLRPMQSLAECAYPVHAFCSQAASAAPFRTAN